jgi:DNA gyrase subunit A
VDEVVRTIRASADASEAREKLMTRRWPAHDIAPYIRLIDDPSHTMNEDGTYNLSEIQARAILELRLQRLTATWGQGGHGRAGRTGRQDQGLP